MLEAEVSEEEREGRDGEGSEGESDVGHVLGTAIPAVRKKRAGEAKESNIASGLLNNISRNLNKVLVSQPPS